MADRNEKVEKVQHEPVKKSLAIAKKDLKIVLDKINNISFVGRTFRLWRAYSQLRPFKTKFRVSRFWAFWSLAILGWIIYYLIKNYISMIKFDKVSLAVNY